MELSVLSDILDIKLTHDAQRQCWAMRHPLTHCHLYLRRPQLAHFNESRTPLTSIVMLSVTRSLSFHYAHVVTLPNDV